MAYGFNSDKSKADLYGTKIVSKYYLRDYSTASPIFTDINLDDLKTKYNYLRIVFFTSPIVRTDPYQAVIPFKGGEAIMNLQDLSDTYGTFAQLYGLTSQTPLDTYPAEVGTVQVTKDLTETTPSYSCLRLYLSSATLTEHIEIYGI